MDAVRPGRGQVRVLHLEPKRAGAPIGYAFLALLFIGGAVAILANSDTIRSQLSGAPTQTPAIAAAAAGFLALLFIGGSIHNGRRWHVARVIERLSNDPAMASLYPDTHWSPS